MDFIPKWVTADSHWLHSAMIDYCQRPPDFNERMAKLWNQTITTGETVLHLGDLVLGKRRDAEEFFEQNPLNGEKYLVLGNHDRRSKSFYRSLGFEVVKPFDLEHNGFTVYCTHYPLIPPVKTLGPTEINLHGHVHQNYVPGLSVQHANMGVDMRHLYPQDTEWHINNTIRRVTQEDRVRDYMPAGKDLEPMED